MDMFSKLNVLCIDVQIRIPIKTEITRDKVNKLMLFHTFPEIQCENFDSKSLNFFSKTESSNVFV